MYAGIAAFFILGSYSGIVIINYNIEKAKSQDNWNLKTMELKFERDQESDRQQQEAERQQKEADRLQKEAEKHMEVLARPRKTLLTQVDRMLEDRKFLPDPQSVLDKFNTTKFRTFSSAMAMEVDTSNLRASLLAKLSTSGEGTVPAKVAQAIAEGISLAKKVTLKERNFEVAGSDSDGHLYTVNIHISSSDGTAAVALLVSGVSFSLPEVVASYDEEQIPVYEDKVVREKVYGGGHYTQPRFEKRKKMVKVADAGWFASEEWKEIEEDVKVQDSQWVPEEKWEVKTTQVLKEYRIKRTPVFSKNALPDNVSVKELEVAMELIAAEEARRVLLQ